ncbi:SMI1/KNR4 family protein [Kordia sp.]|uniref:SMI1/KNR4 family protein n=1 Tax=Kordia sp. TaxID=1965332 RepID=UPI003D6A745A
MRVKYRDLEEGVLENWLITFEEALKINLPRDYRTHILTYNGGSPEGDYVIFDADSADVLVSEDIHLYNFNYLDNGEGSLDEQASRGGARYIPKGIDIGASSGGILMMSLASGEFGSIYHMFSYGEPQKIANSWTEFVSYLIDEDLDE